MKVSSMKKWACLLGAALTAGCGPMEDEHVQDVQAEPGTSGASVQSASTMDGIVITVDNRYQLYVNGALVGQDNDPMGWYQAETWNRYMRSGDVIAVLAMDDGGVGGIIADVYRGGALVLSTGSPRWRCTTTAYSGWTSSAYSDLHWPAAVLHSQNGGGAWGYQSRFSAASYWIWTNDLNNHNTVYCRATVP